MSPFFDAITLARVAKDLGIHGKAIPKIIKGRQYIAFSGYAGTRQIFTASLYSARNAKIINMAIGAMGITKMATKGGIITICLTVPLSIFECYLTDRSTWYELSGSVGADLIKVGTASLMGAVAGIALSGGSAFLVFPLMHFLVIIEQLCPDFIKRIEKYKTHVNYSIMGFIVAMLIAGFAISSWLQSRAENAGYVHCRYVSGVSALAKTLVYTKEAQLCADLEAKARAERKRR